MPVRLRTASPATHRSQDRLHRFWPSFGLPHLVIALIAVAAFWAVMNAPADYDYWWHLADGRFIAQQHRLPVPDPFSFTAEGRRWTAHEWLMELVMYRLHVAFGVAGPLVLFALCFAATLLLSAALWRRMGLAWPFTIALAVALFLALSPFRGPRPYLAGLLLLALCCWLVERWTAQPGRHIWALPPLFYVWANVNASFVVALLITGLALVTDAIGARLITSHRPRFTPVQRLRLGIAIAVSTVVTALTPNGPRLLLFPFATLADPSLRYISEWQAVSPLHSALWGFDTICVLYTAALFLRRPHLSVADFFLSVALVAAGFTSVRLVGVASIYLAVFTARALTVPGDSVNIHLPGDRTLGMWWSARARFYESPPPRLQAINALALLVAFVIGLGRLHIYSERTDARLPVTAIDALGADRLPGPLLHDFNWGGYLLWRLWPHVRVFIDGRQNDLYDGIGRELQQYIQVVSITSESENVINRYEIRTVLFNKDTPLVRYLLARGGWSVTYDDGFVVRLERHTDGTP